MRSGEVKSWKADRDDLAEMQRATNSSCKPSWRVPSRQLAAIAQPRSRSSCGARRAADSCNNTPPTDLFLARNNFNARNRLYDGVSVIPTDTVVALLSDLPRAALRRLSRLPAEMLGKQGVALTGRNRTGPPCSVGRPTAHAPGRRRAYRPRARRPARPSGLCPHAGSVTDDDRRRRQTTTDASQLNNTGPLAEPVIIIRR